MAYQLAEHAATLRALQLGTRVGSEVIAAMSAPAGLPGVQKLELLVCELSWPSGALAQLHQLRAGNRSLLHLQQLLPASEQLTYLSLVRTELACNQAPRDSAAAAAAEADTAAAVVHPAEYATCVGAWLGSAHAPDTHMALAGCCGGEYYRGCSMKLNTSLSVSSHRCSADRPTHRAGARLSLRWRL